MTKRPATIALSITAGLLAAGAAQGTSIDMPGVFFQDGRPIRGESLESSARDAEQLKNLARSVEILKRHPEIKFEVAGHTDRRECSGQGCRDLALRRALLIYRHLLDAGIDPKRVISLSEYASTRPISDEPGKHWINQRIEINYALEP